MGKKCITSINWNLFKKINKYKFIDIVKNTKLFNQNKNGIHGNC